VAAPTNSAGAYKGRRRGQGLGVRGGRGEVALFARPRGLPKGVPRLGPFAPPPLPLRLPLSPLQLPLQLPPLILLPLRLRLLPLPLSPLPLSPPLNLNLTPPSPTTTPKSPQPPLTSSFQFHARFDLRRPRRYQLFFSWLVLLFFVFVLLELIANILIKHSKE
jgi:hypothetical protein